MGRRRLLDIGCYLIHLSRYAFRQEPRRVVGLIERDPQLGIDRLASALLDFPGGHAAITCSTQLIPHQQIQILGTRGCITLEIPINALPDRPARLFLDSAAICAAQASRPRASRLRTMACLLWTKRTRRAFSGPRGAA